MSFKILEIVGFCVAFVCSFRGDDMEHLYELQ